MAGQRKRRKRAQARRRARARNPLVPITRRLGQGVKPSAKVYRRRPKHAKGSGNDTGS